MCVLIIFPDQIYFKVTLISLVVSICFSSPLHPLRHSFRCIVKCGSRYKHCRETSTKSHCHITTGQTKQLCYNKTTDMSLQGDNVLHWLNNTQRSCRTMMYGMQPFKMYIVYSSNTLYTVPIHSLRSPSIPLQLMKFIFYLENLMRAKLGQYNVIDNYLNIKVMISIYLFHVN